MADRREILAWLRGWLGRRMGRTTSPEGAAPASARLTLLCLGAPDFDALEVAITLRFGVSLVLGSTTDTVAGVAEAIADAIEGKTNIQSIDREGIAETVFALLGGEGIAADLLTPATLLKDGLGFKSLDIVDALLGLETLYGVPLNVNGAFARLNADDATVGHLVELVAEALAAKRAPATVRQPVEVPA